MKWPKFDQEMKTLDYNIILDSNCIKKSKIVMIYKLRRIFRFSRLCFSFVLFLRLFIVMGVVWIMESVSFLVESKSIYFFVFDIWNCLQGVLIFIFMICKSRVFRLIKKRFVYLLYYDFPLISIQKLPEIHLVQIFINFNCFQSLFPIQYSNIDE